MLLLLLRLHKHLFINFGVLLVVLKPSCWIFLYFYLPMTLFLTLCNDVAYTGDLDMILNGCTTPTGWCFSNSRFCIPSRSTASRTPGCSMQTARIRSSWEPRLEHQTCFSKGAYQTSHDLYLSLISVFMSKQLFAYYGGYTIVKEFPSEFCDSGILKNEASVILATDLMIKYF